MKIFARTQLFVAALLSAAMPTAAQAPSALESLKPSTALAQVEASSGVVFVDLYAEW